MVIYMGKGPGTIYKDCVAKAIQQYHNTKGKNDIIARINERTSCYCLMEEDVKRAFMLEDYGINATDKYLKQWNDLKMASTIYSEGYRVIAFTEVI